MLARWESYQPCDGAALRATVYFYHPAANSSLLHDGRLHSIWGALGSRVRSCFGGGMQPLMAKLPDRVAFTRLDGACGQFFALFNLLHGRADYFYLMEPDALVVRAGWLERAGKPVDPLALIVLRDVAEHGPLARLGVLALDVVVSHCLLLRSHR